MNLKKKKKSSEQKTKKNAVPVESKQEFVNTSAPKWNENVKTVRRTFPGPANASVELRIAVERRAFADVTAHIMESIDKEVCGVLVGEVCIDDEGYFVHVRAIIEGTSARQGDAHVTFTQETWNHIHQRLGSDYPDFDIVGWYHSHPGFGVLFSEMDLFIQKNFFPSPTQFALVMDPLGGEKAVCVNTEEGIRYIDRFWVDGREHHTRIEKSLKQEGASNDQANETLAMIETRLSQALQAIDKLNLSISRTLMTLITLFLFIIVGLSFYTIYRGNDFETKNQPPKVRQYVPVPVKIGSKEVLLGVGIIQWDIPPGLIPSTGQSQGEPGEQQKESKNWLLPFYDDLRQFLREWIEKSKKQSETDPGKGEII